MLLSVVVSYNDDGVGDDDGIRAFVVEDLKASQDGFTRASAMGENGEHFIGVHGFRLGNSDGDLGHHVVCGLAYQPLEPQAAVVDGIVHGAFGRAGVVTLCNPSGELCELMFLTFRTVDAQTG